MLDSNSSDSVPSFLFKYQCQLICDLDNSLTSSIHEVWISEHHIHQNTRIKPFMLRILLYFLILFQHVFHTLYLRLFCTTTMSIPSSSPTKSPNQAHDPIYKNVTFRHSLFHDKSSVPSCAFCDSVTPSSILLSYLTVPVMTTFNLGSYMVHQVSSTASFFSFTSVFFPSKHSLIQDTGASISIFQTTLHGISKGLCFKYKGIVKWNTTNGGKYAYS